MMTTFLSLIKIMFALVIVCYSWSSSASTLPGSPIASNSSQLNGESPNPLSSPLALKSVFSSGGAFDSEPCITDSECTTFGSVCAHGECTCHVGYTPVDGEVGIKVCKVVSCSSSFDFVCLEWPNTYCADGKCVCSTGYRLDQQMVKCEEIPTEPPSTTTSTTSSTTTSTTPSTTTSSTSSITSSTGCKPSDCSRVCQANAVCMKKSYACACDCPIGFKQRIEGPIVYCDPHDCAQEKLGCYWLHTFCRGADHKCACMHGYQLDPDDPSTCEPIPGWTTRTAATSTDVSAKVGAILWKTVFWIIGIVVVLILVAICIAIVVCCFCCKSDKSKQARYNNNKSNAPMAPSKYPQMVPYPTPGSSDYGKGGPIMVAIPGTSGFKGSKAVSSGSTAQNPQYPMAPFKYSLVASTPSGHGNPKKKPILASNPGSSRSKGSKDSKDSKAVPSNGSKVPNPPYPI